MKTPEHLIVKNKLKKLGSPKKAKASSWFFKTGPGQYGEGDKFYGVTVPEQRVVSLEHKDLKLTEIQKLLDDEVHECRLTGLLILAGQFEKADVKNKKKIFSFYTKNSKKINNWDLVDCSATYIAGSYLLDKDKSLLYRYAVSKNIWQRRIAIVSTCAFIRNGEFKDTLEISKILLQDKEDLIHKAVGWMLREVAKKDTKILEDFLSKNVKIMPRTTLRYSIERFSEDKRKKYLNK